jgi:hypothetical protein
VAISSSVISSSGFSTLGGSRLGGLVKQLNVGTDSEKFICIRFTRLEQPLKVGFGSGRKNKCMIHHLPAGIGGVLARKIYYVADSRAGRLRRNNDRPVE